jgi:hypothetical protein
MKNETAQLVSTAPRWFFARIVLMRGILVALFVVLSPHVWAQETQGVGEKTPSPKETENGNANPSQHNLWKSALKVVIVESPDQAKRTADRDQQSNAHDEADLQAQIAAAEASAKSAASAERQENLALFQLVLSGAGIIALLVTIYYTIKSANAAVDAARAAEAHVADARKHRRPLIQVNVIGRVAKGGNQLLPKHRQRMPFNLHNFGAAPANIIRYDTRILTAAEGKYPAPISPDTNEGYNTNGAIVVGPESDGPRTHSQKFDNPASNLVSDWLFFMGFIEYADMDGRTYVHGFCQKFDPSESCYRLAWPEDRPQDYNYTRETTKSDAGAT